MEHEDMEKTEEEIFIDALYEEVPVIIVEGRDDVPFYSGICRKIQKSGNVVAVENIKGYGANCDNVIKAVEKIQDAANDNDMCKKLLLGIIDRDARYYRNELPINECLLVLNFYSYESHLTTRHSIEQLILEVTSISDRMIDDSLYEYIMEGIEEELNRLYYISLEALRNACEQEYTSLVRYKEDKIERYIKNVQLQQQLNEKREQLEQFANQKDISIKDVRKIAKGKWYLDVWVKHIYRKLVKMTNKCKIGEINQCQYCRVRHFNQCLYKIEANFQESHIKSLLNKIYDDQELGYIYERLRLLA